MELKIVVWISFQCYGEKWDGLDEITIHIDHNTHIYLKGNVDEKVAKSAQFN